MPYLDAALAFALTMLVVATLVTQIVRFLINSATVRREGLKKMLKEYFDTEFQPVIQREMNRLTTTAGTRIISELNKELTKFDPSLELSKAEQEKLASMSTEELLERLKRTDLGQQLLKKLGDKAQAVFNELGKRYEVIGDKFTYSFRKRSQLWATLIAFVLALVINIDSIYIANTYINNVDARQAIIAQKDVFVEDYDTLAKKLEEEQGKETFTKADLEDAFKESREQLNLVTSGGFPIGWSYFPHSYFIGEKENWGSSQDFQNRNNLLGWLTWVLGILATSGLAGLGGPFWYDAISGISRVVKSTRGDTK